MTDLRARMRIFDQAPAPDYWSQVQLRASTASDAAPPDRSARSALLLVAALVTILTISAAIAVGSGVIELPWPVESPIPSPSAAPPSERPGVTGGGTLTWTQVAVDERSLALLDPDSLDFRPATIVAWLGDRFVLVDQLPDAKVVSTSTDGRVWDLLDESDPGWDSYSLLSASSATATWEHDTVLWTSGVYTSDLNILRPPDKPVTKSDFSGGVGAVGIGPRGIVVHVHSAVDFDAYVTSVLGPGWVEHMVSFSFQDGILRITTNDDRALEIVWADQGFEPGDVADRGFGWYSADGDEWTPVPGFPANVSEVVGAPDGFFARGGQVRCDGCADPAEFGMWHSPDGLTWREIGPAAMDGTVLPWGQGVLVTDGATRFDVWTAEGGSELPMAEGLLAGWTASDVAFGGGPLGFVSVNVDEREVLFTPNGVDWSAQPMSADMTAAAGLSRTVPSWNVAVGQDSVVVLLWAGGLESGVPSLWVGTPAP